MPRSKATGKFPPPDDEQERLTIEGTVQITDEIVAAKEQEIAELKVALAAKSGGTKLVAGAVSASQAAIDNDQLVQQEREKLKQLKQEMSEKLRQAEVELSLERAKLARQRAEIEEKLATLPGTGTDSSGSLTESDKPTRGRWLSRLGLSDLDEE